jgi:septal ring factor EnvC (AmiA/AmiB activator)
MMRLGVAVKPVWIAVLVSLAFAAAADRAAAEPDGLPGFPKPLGAFPPTAASPQAATAQAQPATQPRPQAAQPEPRASASQARPRTRREGDKLDPELAREIYWRRKKRLEQIEAEQRELQRDAALLTSNRARMQDRLIETARSMRVAERRLTEIEARLAEARSKVAEQEEVLVARSQEMSELFALMQRMSRNPPPVMITRSGDAFKMIRSGMVLANFYADVEKLAAEITTEIDSLNAAVREAEAQETRRRTEQSEYARLKSQIDLLLVENQEQLRANKERMEALKQAVKIHTAAMKDLRDIVPRLDAEVAKNSELGAYEQELASGRQELVPDVKKVALLQPGRMKPSIPFAQAKGLLPLPAEGPVVARFGQSRDGIESKGLQIKTRAAAQVTAPADGWIVYAGEFRAYGQLLIINAGGGYHILLAGMERIQAEVGQFVLAGEPVATMGGVQQARPKDEPGIQPTLYVELRKDQQPVDPAPWWSAGGGKG